MTSLNLARQGAESTVNGACLWVWYRQHHSANIAWSYRWGETHSEGSDGPYGESYTTHCRVHALPAFSLAQEVTCVSRWVLLYPHCCPLTFQAFDDMFCSSWQLLVTRPWSRWPSYWRHVHQPSWGAVGMVFFQHPSLSTHCQLIWMNLNQRALFSSRNWVWWIMGKIDLNCPFQGKLEEK